MDNFSIDPSFNAAFARFFRSLSQAAVTLAEELEAPAAPPTSSLADLDLGSLQRQVAMAEGMDSGLGVSPRQISNQLGRLDEPNIRTALNSLRKRGVAELVPGAAPQRWRLTARYRSAAA